MRTRSQAGVLWAERERTVRIVRAWASWLRRRGVDPVVVLAMRTHMEEAIRGKRTSEPHDVAVMRLDVTPRPRTVARSSS